MSRKASDKSPETKGSAEQSGACRLDIWLFRTRLLKTRSLAARMISNGKVRVTRNGHVERVQKPHTLIRAGDRVIFMRGRELISVEMIEPGTRRGPASEAQALYMRQEEAELSR